MRLFTKDIDKKLFGQFKHGSDLSKQKVIAKIYNPTGRGTWYIINSDENDPDYLWAIVDIIEVEVGSVSREELETLKVPPFRLGLERDMSFEPINALEVLNGLRSGKRYEAGGYMAKGGGVDSYEIYHETLSGALEEVENWVEKNGYSFIEDNYFPDVTVGGINYGETKRFSRAITKKGKPIYSEGKLMIQIYRLDSGRYELNLYPSYEGGGSLDDENKQMLLNQAEGFEHHANELESAVKKADHVPAWVVAKSQRASTDLSDITHYLDGENEQKREMEEGEEMALGGYMAKGGEIKVDGRTIRLKYVKRCCPSVKSDGTVGNYQYEFTDEQGNPFIGYGNSKQEALESIEKYLNTFKEGGYMAKGGDLKGKEVKAKNSVDLIKESVKYGTRNVRVDFFPAYDARKHSMLPEKLIKLLKKPKVSFFDAIEDLYDIILLQKEKDERGVRSITWVVESSNKKESGGATFDEKVSAVKSSLLKRKKVSPKVQKDYGKTYSPKEAEASAKRIVGAMTAKERLAAKLKKGKK